MGQKVNPASLRLQLNRDWQSKWIAKKGYADQLIEDIKLRGAVEKKLGIQSAISGIEIERTPKQIVLTIYTARPGIIIGRGGAGIDDLRKTLEKGGNQPIKINIMEVRKPELDAKLVAENIAAQLEKRIGYRRAIKMANEAAMRSGAKGIKVMVAGRLGGAEMSRRETISTGSIPLQTIRANIDFSRAVAKTTYGVIGVKVWIHIKKQES